MVQCWLAEFEGLRNLILNSQRMQHNLIWVNTSAIGAIVAAVIQLNNPTVLLALPIISGLLGIYWVGQGTQISEMGHYVKDKIAPALQTICHNQEVMGWEAHIRPEIAATGIKKRLSEILGPFRLPRAIGGFTFIVSCVFGLATTFNAFTRLEHLQTTVLWISGLILTLYLGISGLMMGRHWIWGK